jgi:LacI family transcriptional regulator
MAKSRYESNSETQNLAGKGVTIRVVALKAGVSIATVSRVLNSVARGVDAGLRTRVLKAARELHYRPNILARSLQRKTTNSLGLIIPDIANPAFAQITRGVEDICRHSGYRLLICNTDYDSVTTTKYIYDLRQRQVDAVIVVVAKPPARTLLSSLAQKGFPTVLIGRCHFPLPSVRIDNVKGGWEAASYLARLGHRQIGIISGPTTFTNMQDRMKGYTQALSEYGISCPKSWVVQGDLRPASALPLAERLLSAQRRPTAILAVNDQTAIATIRAALTLGLRVPEDVSVIGFDNITLASYVSPALTTMNSSLPRIGEAAAEMAIRQLSGSRETQEVWFTPELIIRESTSPPTLSKA